MLINLSKTDFGSLNENVTRLKVSNMYLVENPLSPSGYSYVARPTLSIVNNIPGTSLRGIWYQASEGVTKVYVVANDTLYLLNADGTYTRLGNIPGTGFCTFTSTIYYIAIASDGRLFLYNGAALTEVAVPDGARVSDVTSLDNYVIVGIEGTNKFYWINPGGLTIDGLSFASAERNPDDIVTLTAVGDELWVIGQSTIEIFTDSGDINAPFVRIPGRVYQIGCQDKHSVVRTLKDTLPCLIWVTPSKEVVLAQGIPSKISNESIEELLKTSSTFTAWSFRTSKHDFYALTTDTVTVVYDITNSAWYRWSSYGQATWKAVFGVQINDTIFAVNANNGETYQLSFDNKDLATDFLVCEVGGFIPNPTNSPMLCNSITLLLNYGFSSSYAQNPIIELRWSDDGGATWSTYMQGTTGVRGRYDTDVRYRSLGKIVKPGRYIELRFSEIQTFRLDGAVMNDEL